MDRKLPVNEEIRYKLLKILDQNPSISQRELSRELGVSVGKVNYCMQALKERGLVKARNFKNNPNKKGYLYVLTPKGIEEKAYVAKNFLKHKLTEFNQIQQEIESLKKEVMDHKE